MLFTPWAAASAPTRLLKTLTRRTRRLLSKRWCFRFTVPHILFPAINRKQLAIDLARLVAYAPRPSTPSDCGGGGPPTS